MVTRGQRGGRDEQGSPGDFAVMDTLPSTLVHTHRTHGSKQETNKTAPGEEPVWGVGAQRRAHVLFSLHSTERLAAFAP